MSARDRIRVIIEKWFLSEPVLFAAWTTHALVVEPRIRTIRVHHGRVEYNPNFIAALPNRLLEVVLQFEAMRILLKHPYGRRKEDPIRGYDASNLTLQEYLQTELPIPRASERFGTDEYDLQYFEFYYQLLQAHGEGAALGTLMSTEGAVVALSAGAPAAIAEGGARVRGRATREALALYVDPAQIGHENADDWTPDEFLIDRIDELIRDAQASNQWGTVAGRCREHVLATLRPRLDYRAVLRQFRMSILSQRRRLTRMRPNRRYGFDYLGSRREFTTRLLVAVDVSGSMSSDALRRGFSLVNRFFKYGVESVDVIQFDAEMQGEPMSLKRARHEIEVSGRGGTNLDVPLRYIDEHTNYDGMIVYTDGYAPKPNPPTNRRTRILWLFEHQSSYKASYPALKHIGKGAYLKDDQQDLPDRGDNAIGGYAAGSLH